MTKQSEHFIKLVYSQLIQGKKLYQERARLAFPYLARYAKARQTISYSALAEAIGMPNARNLNYVLGAIGNPLGELSKLLKTPIPPLTCIVLNKTTGVPGNGVGWYKPMKEFVSMNKVSKKELVDTMLVDIYNYPDWDLMTVFLLVAAGCLSAAMTGCV